MTHIPEYMQRTRALLAARYLRGSGIEIGALDVPLEIPPQAKVRYVDRLSVSQLRDQYPTLHERPLVEPDLIEDGERLPNIASASLDFIIANHMLEHCENPLGTMRAHLDRVRPGGVLFYAIPDKRQCFDCDRPLTRFDHLLADDGDGGASSRHAHFLEWATYVNGITDTAAAAANAEANMRFNYSIHFHVWSPDSYRRFLEEARNYLHHTFTVEHFVENGPEIISVLKRS